MPKNTEFEESLTMTIKKSIPPAQKPNPPIWWREISNSSKRCSRS